MSIDCEFETVDLVLDSSAETRGVDAFALSMIKAERQARKLFTHLVYQHPAFGVSDVAALRGVLGSNRRVYVEGFLAGFDALYVRSIQTLVGQDYAHLKGRLDEAIEHRNKIFHGQLTARALTRDDLIRLVIDIKKWCQTLASAALVEIGYDGFERNSFRKSSFPDLVPRLKVSLRSVDDYEAFIGRYMTRR